MIIPAPVSGEQSVTLYRDKNKKRVERKVSGSSKPKKEKYYRRQDKTFNKHCIQNYSSHVRTSSKSKNQTTFEDIDTTYDLSGKLRDTYIHTKWDYTTPGHGHTPKSCHNPKITHIGIGKYLGKSKSHWRACNEAGCHNSCHETWRHTQVHHTLTKIIKTMEENPKLKAWAGVVALKDEHHLKYTNKLRDMIARYTSEYFKSKGVPAYVKVFHSYKIHEDVEKAITANFKDKHGRLPTGSELHNLIHDVDYLNSLGFDFKTWHDAVSPLYHWHVLILSETKPDINLHGNQNNKFAKLLRANLHVFNGRTMDIKPYRWDEEQKKKENGTCSYRQEGSGKKISYRDKYGFRVRIYNSNNLLWEPSEFKDWRKKYRWYLPMYNTHEPTDENSCAIIRNFNPYGFWHPTYRQMMLLNEETYDQRKVKPIETLPEIVWYLEYLFNHAAISNKPGLIVRSSAGCGILYDMKISYNSADQNPAAVKAFEAMVEAAYWIKWVGNRMYSGHDAPTFNEDMPAQEEKEEDSEWVPIQEFEVGYVIDKESGELKEPPWAEEVIQRIKDHIKAVEEFEHVKLADGSIMEPYYKPSIIIRKIFDALNDNIVNRKIKPKDQGVYLYEIPDIEVYIAFGWHVDGGRCSQKVFFGRHLRRKSDESFKTGGSGSKSSSGDSPPSAAAA